MIKKWLRASIFIPQPAWQKPKNYETAPTPCVPSPSISLLEWPSEPWQQEYSRYLEDKDLLTGEIPEGEAELHLLVAVVEGVVKDLMTLVSKAPALAIQIWKALSQTIYMQMASMQTHRSSIHRLKRIIGLNLL